MYYKTISLIILIITLIICINAVISNWLDKKTKYKRDLSYEKNCIIFLFIIFGIFLIPFIKKIKNYRKNKYFIDRYRLIMWESVSMKKFPDIFEKIWGKQYQECQDYFRYEKIKKLQRKSKSFYKRILA